MEQFTVGDLVVAGVVILSALAAMARGFTREILGLVALVVAAAGAYFLAPAIAPQVKSMVDLAEVSRIVGMEEDLLAGIGAGAGLFILIWVVAVFIANWISNMIVFSAAGAMDRTLGFVFGAARGLFIMAVVFLVAQYLVYPSKIYPDWIAKARLLPVMEWSADLVDDAARSAVENWTGRELAPRTPPAPVEPAGQGVAPAPDGSGYTRSATREMDRAVGTLTGDSTTGSQ